MIRLSVLTEDFFRFIEEHLYDDALQLRLKVNPQKYDFDIEFAILQIESRRKYALKLPYFLSFQNFLFPDAISGEQASHQAVARFHASLLNKGGKVLDMTAGLGIDSISFCEKAKEVTAVELNPHKAKILKENALSMSLKNLNIENCDSIDFLRNSDHIFDAIFIDPSRRDASNKRVFNLHDCQPDVIENQNLLLSHSQNVYIKASPLLDITQAINDFPNLNSIYVIGVKGECKEVLLHLSLNENMETIRNNSIRLTAIDLTNNGEIKQQFQTERFEIPDLNITPEVSEEDLKDECYILEPSAMMMKLSPWKEISQRWNAKKFAKNSHLFITSNFPEDFSGRVTKFRQIIKNKDRKSLSGLPASVVARNYPLSSEEIRKALKLKEGDQKFIYATRIGTKPVILLSESVT